MNFHKRLLFTAALLAGCYLLIGQPDESLAYIEAPHSFGQVVAQSTNIFLMRVEKVDREKNLIVYKKIEDIKGKHPTDIIKHNIGKAGFHPREWQYSIEWAEPGKTAIMFHNGGASETYTGTYWYQAYAGDWWGMSHGEPFLLRTYAAGSPEKLAAAVKEVMAGKEIVVPCMVDGNKDDLHLRRAKIQRLKASLKLQNYDQKRDFVGWGGEDFRRIQGLPGFTHYSALPRIDPEAQAISSVDFDGDGKADLCLIGGNRCVLLQNGGDAMNELSLPGVSGCRAAVWADYNASGLPSVLLATSSGPKLFTNLGKNNFRDDTHLLPREAAYNCTAACWMDFDGDGKPDILLANGFHGLRLYRNKGAVAPGARPIEMGGWYYCGPFANPNQKGFDTVYPPEREQDLKKTYPGKNNVPCPWKEGQFTDGQVNNLALFQGDQNIDSVIYLYREITCSVPLEVPVSMGSDDTLTVWLNGEKIVSQNVQRGVAPDQANVTMKLKAGKNTLLIKVCQGGGEWAYYFAPKINIPPAVTWDFEDVSSLVNLGPEGIGSFIKGDTLTVCDVNGDGRPDFLYGAGTGMLVLNTPKGFVEAKDSGISYQTGKIGPVFGDFDGDGFPDLFVPQNGTCKLFKNDGKGKFTEVTTGTGDLSKAWGQATCAAWGDLNNDGKLDLVVGYLRGPNRWFRNAGNGKFVEASEEIGLNQKIYNTQGICLVDLNNRGVLDVIFANEGQESCILLGNPEAVAGKRAAVTLTVGGNTGVLGSVVRVLDAQGKPVATEQVSGGDGRGGQRSPQARFALDPGNYKVEVRYSNGVKRTKEITVAQTPMRAVIEEKE